MIIRSEQCDNSDIRISHLGGSEDSKQKLHLIKSDNG